MSGESNGKGRRRAAAHADHGGGHHGGAWKVAYADFTTAMMAFFLLLWILSSSSKEQKQSIANYFREQGPFRTGGASLGGGALEGGSGVMPDVSSQMVNLDMEMLQKAAETLQETIDSQRELEGVADQVEVYMNEDGLVIEISEDRDDAFFALGSATMSATFEQILDDVAISLAGTRNQVRIEGHTDARQYPAGAAYSNWELSADRANAARRRLEQRGLERARFESVVGYADGRPVVGADPYAPANRRITITVLRREAAAPAGAAGVGRDIGAGPLVGPEPPPARLDNGAAHL
jgi:chemotaxis protein MotB